MESSKGRGGTIPSRMMGVWWKQRSTHQHLSGSVADKNPILIFQESRLVVTKASSYGISDGNGTALGNMRDINHRGMLHQRLQASWWVLVLLPLLLMVAMETLSTMFVQAQETDICVDEQEALDQCVNGAFALAIPSSQNATGGSAPEEQELAFTLDVQALINDNCDAEKRALEQCLIDNGVNSGLEFCGLLYLPLWTTCRLIYVVVLACLSCSSGLSLIDKSCEEFEDNTCERLSCCRFCESLAQDYSDCVQERGVCSSDFFDCESGRSGWFWFMIAAFCILGLALTALIIYLLKRNPNRHEPTPVVVQAQPTVVHATDTSTAEETPAKT